MRGAQAIIWAVCLACVQPVVCPRIPSSRSVRDRPRPAQGTPTDRAECFSDYMTLRIPRARVEGLRQWLARTLHPLGTWRSPGGQGHLLAQCGYLLHPGPEGHFIFQALYSACFVQKENANYRLEIRIFRKGVKRLEQSDRYIMKCPVVPPRPGQQSVLCRPSFIQVSRPLPLRTHSGQAPWLLSLRGEMVVSLEDASLMGLHVDLNVTTITVQIPRRDLLQRQEVQNVSMELLPLWLVGGHYAYSLEAACPLVSPQPDSEVFVHIPKRRLGLIRRGPLVERGLSLSFLRVHQSDPVAVIESKDFLVVSLPAAALLRAQPCQESQGAPGVQASYRVDLSLGFSESLTPVLWTVENFFQCMGSGAEFPASTVTPRIIASNASPSLETLPEGTSSAATTQRQPTGLTRGPPSSLPAAGPPGGSHASTAAGLSRTTQDQCGPRDPLGESGLLGNQSPWPPATLSSEPTAAARAKPLHPVSQDPPALTAYLPPEVSSPQLPWGLDGSKVLPSVTFMEGSRTRRLEQDPAQLPGSLGALSTVQPSQDMPDQASGDVQPSRWPLWTGLAKEASVSPQETAFITEAEGPPQMEHGPPQDRTWGPLGQSPPHPRQERLPTAGGGQAGTRSHPGVSEPPGQPAAPRIAFPESPVASTSEKLLVSSHVSETLTFDNSAKHWQEHCCFGREDESGGRWPPRTTQLEEDSHLDSTHCLPRAQSCSADHGQQGAA
ncbi:PREDICTED: uncharacterized protein C1orf127 homolog [Dipodomys ordii]|uniref:Uncharacterized protein C1orf127 homolog n=1 Tax=Dipodomys ordii TaxID=10020 RepID=A0A1S3GEY3_DIPOR|nr:PREDICTED: uncharacterized protein C1orf127 homolog [Dipodomys ordii]